MVSIYVGSEFPINVDAQAVGVYLLLMLAVVLAFYVLRSIGLYSLAKRQNFKRAYFAWIPLLWFYIACKLVGKGRFFNRPVENLATILTIIFAVNQIVAFITNVLAYYPVVANMLSNTGHWAIGAKPNGFTNAGFLVGDIFHSGQMQLWNYAPNVYFVVEKVVTICNYILVPLNIVAFIVEITVYMGLFKKYIPQHYVLFMLLSSPLVGIFAPLVFAIRKKQPISYSDYLRSRYYTPYGRYGGYSNYNANPYGQNNTQNQAPPKNPFEEFAQKGEVDPGDPFDEFNNEDKN